MLEGNDNTTEDVYTSLANNPSTTDPNALKFDKHSMTFCVSR